MVRVASRVVIRVNLARVAHRLGQVVGRVERVVVTHHQVARRLLNGEHLTVKIRMITSHTILPSLSHHIPSLSQLTPSHRMIVLIHTPSHLIASRAIVKTHTPSRHTLSHRTLSHRILSRHTPSHRIPNHHILRIHTIPRMQGGENQNGDRPQALRHGLREVASLERAVEDLAHLGRAVERREKYEGI